MCSRDGPLSLSPRPSPQWTLAHCTSAMAARAHVPWSPRALPPRAVHTTHSPRAKKADAVRSQRGLRPGPRAAEQRPDHRAVPKEEEPQEKLPHLGPFHDAVQAEVVGAALGGPHGLVPESIQTNGAALGIVVRVKCTAGLQAPLRICHYFQVVVVAAVVVVFRIFRALRKGKHCTCVK